MFNFLIAIVSKTYDGLNAEAAVSKYEHRSMLNRECRLIFSKIQILNKIFPGFVKEIDTLVIQSNVQGQEELNDAQMIELRSNIKAYIRHENIGLKMEMDDRFKQIETNIAVVSNKLETSIG